MLGRMLQAELHPLTSTCRSPSNVAVSSKRTLWRSGGVEEVMGVGRGALDPRGLVFLQEEEEPPGVSVHTRQREIKTCLWVLPNVPGVQDHSDEHLTSGY